LKEDGMMRRVRVALLAVTVLVAATGGADAGHGGSSGACERECEKISNATARDDCMRECADERSSHDRPHGRPTAKNDSSGPQRQATSKKRGHGRGQQASR
jgi:hypothetical protein